MDRLFLHTSNKMEILVNQLAEILINPLDNPFIPENIIVQSKGMERWISMELSRIHGICANYQFPFPNAFIYNIFENIIPDELPLNNQNKHAVTFFQRDNMAWHIMKILPELIVKNEFYSLKKYLEDGNELKRYQIACRISDTFDNYILFRPEIILGWEKGRDDDNWQAILWREIKSTFKIKHSALLGNILLNRIKQKQIKNDNLPQRFSIFGISSLPPFHIRILMSLSLLCEVHIFLLNPCKEFWNLIKTDKEKIIIEKQYPETSVADLHIEKGNTLLASSGKLGRDFFNLIYNIIDEYSLNWIDNQYFEEQLNNNLLEYIQEDILLLRDRGHKDNQKIIKSEDRSVVIHSCHSPMREVEVLYDQLLYFFQKDPELTPQDVIVMTPDIHEYAPYIQTVFESPNSDDTRFLFSIADQNMQNENTIADTFLKILNLSKSRFKSSQILEILECSYVRVKFNIEDKQIEIIRKWIEDTKIRWGIDEDNREDLKLPGFKENTWQSGLDRLLLGYAMPSENDEIYKNIIPYNEIEGESSKILGNFMLFFDLLNSMCKKYNIKHTIDDWVKILLKTLKEFFNADNQSERDIKAIYDIIIELKNVYLDSLSYLDNEIIDISVIYYYLKKKFEKKISGYGFLTGGLTFCAMLPMRSIPFKIICLIGMNDNAFPRSSTQLGFDIIAQNPKLGDRSQRNDDRYIFLESLLCARKKLYISYVGQSIIDNSLLPPSVLVSELISYIDQGFRFINNKTKIIERICVKHHLHGFHKDYFQNNEKYFSFSKNNYNACKILYRNENFNEQNERIFLNNKLDDIQETTLKFEDLIFFFKNPAKYFLNKRFGIFLDDDPKSVDEKEPLILSRLEEFFINKELLNHIISDLDPEKYYYNFKIKGELPHGNPGKYCFNNLKNNITGFAQKLHQFVNCERQIVKIDIQLNCVKLIGSLNVFKNKGLVQYRYAKVKAKDFISFWINHLILCSINDEKYIRSSILAGKDDFYRIDIVENSKEILEKLYKLYKKGNTQQIHFFPETSYAYAENFINGNSEQKCISKANNVFQGNDYSEGESFDKYIQLLFKNYNPIDDDFINISKEFFMPLLNKIEKIHL